MKKFLLIILTLFLLYGCKEGGSSDSTPSTPGTSIPADQLWQLMTPAGITVVSDKGTLAQYEARWEGDGFHWSAIDWEALDGLFYEARDYYCNYIGWNCKNVKPYQLTIRIMPWDSRCTDEESPLQPKEIYTFINGAWQCIDGWEWHGTTYTHLGDDPGQDHTNIYSDEPLSFQEFKAWQETSVPHELMHFFQYMSGLSYSETPPVPPVVFIINLPEEEENDDDEKTL